MENKLKRKNNENNITKADIKKSSVNGKKRKKKNNIIVIALCLLLGIIIGVMATVMILDKKNSNKLSKLESEQQATGTLEDMIKEEGFIIETPFVKLHYPEKWKNQTSVEQVEGDIYTVKFSAAIDGKEDIHIFDIVFGGEEGFTLGYIDEKGNDKTPINVISYEVELDDDYTEEEKNMIYTMAEDVNYIIGMLQEEDRFVPAS